MKRGNIKTIIIIIALSVLVIASFEPFLILARPDWSSSRMMTTFSIKGVWVAIGGVAVLLYSYVVGKKGLTLISYLVSFFGYGYTFYVINKAINLLEDPAQRYGVIDINYQIGFYLYVVSGIILLISIFVGNKSEEIPNNYDTKELDKDSFLLCNMLLGVKEIPYNLLVLLKKVDDSLSLEYQVGEEIKNIKIKLDKIKDISYQPDLTIDYSDNSLGDKTMANTLLSYSLLAGHPVAALGATGLLNNLTEDYEEGKVKTCYIVVIKYMDNAEEKELKLKVRKNPNRFINYIKKI